MKYFVATIVFSADVEGSPVYEKGMQDFLSNFGDEVVEVTEGTVNEDGEEFDADGDPTDSISSF